MSVLGNCLILSIYYRCRIPNSRILMYYNKKYGVETTLDNFGFSETSKKKDDRELSGLAKGFLVSFTKEDGTNVGEFIVGLNGFDNSQKRELLENKEQYIGRHFKYTGMKPVLSFPRHAFFKEWRDEK